MNNKAYIVIKLCSVMVMSATLIGTALADPQTPPPAVNQTALNQTVSQLGATVDDLARDLSSLEKELLFPTLTRTQLYVSLANNVAFTPRSVTIALDDDEKSFHIYSADDVAALRLGGLQRFWEGNVALGKHQLVATVKGVDAKGAVVEQHTQFAFEKNNKGHSLELQILADKKAAVPLLQVKDWGEK